MSNNLGVTAPMDTLGQTIEERQINQTPEQASLIKAVELRTKELSQSPISPFTQIPQGSNHIEEARKPKAEAEVSSVFFRTNPFGEMLSEKLGTNSPASGYGSKSLPFAV